MDKNKKSYKNNYFFKWKIILNMVLINEIKLNGIHENRQIKWWDIVLYVCMMEEQFKVFEIWENFT